MQIVNVKQTLVNEVIPDLLNKFIDPAFLEALCALLFVAGVLLVFGYIAYHELRPKKS